jgi:glutathione S-transferase
MMDRVFDNYVMTPQGSIVFNAIRQPQDRDPYGEAQARSMLETAYAWLDERMADREWAVGETFTLADCAAAPSLFYADWTHQIDPRFGHLLAYRRRLLARPSFARAVDEARPYRSYFPLGAPDRD